MRETEEEIGLDLRKSRILGRLPSNFFAYYKRNQSLMISGNVFLLHEENLKDIKLNSSEV